MDDIRQDEETRHHVEPMMDGVYGIPAFSSVSNQRSGQPKLKARYSQHVTRGDIFGATTTQPAVPQHEETLYKWVWKRDQYGREYKELVEFSPSISPARPRHVVETAPGWQYDEQTNRMYRTQVPSVNTLPGLHNHQHQKYVDSRTDGITPVRQSALVVHTPVKNNADRSERFPGIVPLSSQPAENREGKIPMSIASHARNMPIEFAR